MGGHQLVTVSLPRCAALGLAGEGRRSAARGGMPEVLALIGGESSALAASALTNAGH